MGKYAISGTILLAILAYFLFSAGPMVSSPQQHALIAGASANVGGGRATMWFAQPTDIYTGGRIVSAAQISLKCKGNETGVTVLPGEFSDSVCGVRVKLLKLIEPGDQGNDTGNERSRVFRATFEVAW